MTLCPIAIVVGCKKCPVFKICPVKGLIGDMPQTPEVHPIPAKGHPAGQGTSPGAQAKAKTKTSAKPRPAAARKKK